MISNIEQGGINPPEEGRFHPDKLTIVGFNGTSVGLVGLSEPIMSIRLPNKPVPIYLKVGTYEPSPISEGQFEEFHQRGLLTKHPHSSVVNIPRDVSPADYPLTVVFAQTSLLRDLGDVESSSSYSDNYSEPVTGVDIGEKFPLYKNSEIYYWLGDRNVERARLIGWSEKLDGMFDEEWRRLVAEDPTNDNRWDKLYDKVWQALACAYDDGDKDWESHLRLFAYFLQRNPSEELTKWQFGQATAISPWFRAKNPNWSDFRNEAESLRQKLNVITLS